MGVLGPLAVRVPDPHVVVVVLAAPDDGGVEDGVVEEAVAVKVLTGVEQVVVVGVLGGVRAAVLEGVGVRRDPVIQQCAGVPVEVETVA